MKNEIRNAVRVIGALLLFATATAWAADVKLSQLTSGQVIGNTTANAVLPITSGAQDGTTPAIEFDTNHARTSGNLACFKNNDVSKLCVTFAGGAVFNADTTGSLATTGATTEQLTLGTGAAATATSGNLAPANARIKAILVRVTTTITTAASFNVKVTGGNAWKNYATGSQTLGTVTANTTYVLLPNAFADDFNASATTLTVTCNTTPGAGVVRLTVVYESFTAPTS